MGEIILNNCKLWVGKYDMSGKLNAIALNDNPDILDNTTFGHTAKSRKKGLEVVTAALEGFWEQEPDEFFSVKGVGDIPLIIAPTPAEGEHAYAFLSQNVEYKLGESVGELLKFSVKTESVGQQMIRGHILLNGIKSLSGNGTAFELGAIGATQKMYASLCVVSASPSDTLDVKIQSDNLEAFGDPTDQITFTQVNLGAGGGGTYEWKTKDGSVTDTWWKVNYTIAGVDPSFTFVVFVGIN